MGTAYYIVLDREIFGLDAFVNGKAVARESDRLARVTQTLGLRDINKFVSANPDELIAAAEQFGVGLPFEPPPETWFSPQDGLDWISKVQNHLVANPSDVNDAEAVLADLREYHDVLDSAKANDVRWHFAVDY